MNNEEINFIRKYLFDYVAVDDIGIEDDFKFKDLIYKLLELYNKEKEKNFKRSDMIFCLKAENTKLKNRNKELEEENETLNWYFKNQKQNLIHKDKIKEKIEEIQNEYFKILENNTLSLETQNYNAQRYEAMKNVLEELLEEGEK